MNKQVYDFNEGNAQMRDILGGKGANLAEMTRLGLPIPKGFTISTQACMTYLNKKKDFPQDLIQEIKSHVKSLQLATGKSFNDSAQLLLVSVRSGAKQSMPGMMDTILNLGLNDDNLSVLAEETGNWVFTLDCYRRLIQMYGNVVAGIPSHYFEGCLDKVKTAKGYKNDTDLNCDDWQEIITDFKAIYYNHCQASFPQEPMQQLFGAIAAVFSSWNNERAQVYRQLNDIPDDLGTAVNIQEMVYGNTGNQSGTGVAFTRNPATGENGLFGEYLINAQGEDVVAGVRTPASIDKLATDLPQCYDELVRLSGLLENHYCDMQDIEFTIENGKLYLLQTRNGKRTAKAAFNIAVSLVNEGLISKEQALMLIEAKSVDQVLHPTFSAEAVEAATLLTDVGLPASPGAASGRVYFDAETAQEKSQAGEKVILLRQETSPEDINGMVVSQAIVTSRGGMTSHAAVVARGMGCCCVVGCLDLEIDEEVGLARVNGQTLQAGDYISVDGTEAKIYAGQLAMVPSTG